MTRILQKIIQGIVEDFIKKSFTIDNLKLLRDEIRIRIKAYTDSTETKLDDWLVVALDYVLTDESIEKIYQFVFEIVGSMNVCKANPYDYTILAQNLLQSDEEGTRCGAPVSVSGILAIVEILVPMLIDWLKHRLNNPNNA